jgi:hypothetical protein
VGLGLAHAFRVALPQPAERRLSRPLVAQRSSAVEAGADPYAELGCPGRAGAKAACWLRQKTSTAAMKQASAMGPNGGVWPPIMSPKMPSKIGTDNGAPAWRRKVTPAAIMEIRIARLPMLANTPRSRTNGFSAKFLDQLRPGPSLLFRPPVQLTREDAVGGPCNVSQALKKTTKGTSAVRLTRAAVPSIPRRSR